MHTVTFVYFAPCFFFFFFSIALSLLFPLPVLLLPLPPLFPRLIVLVHCMKSEPTQQPSPSFIHRIPTNSPRRLILSAFVVFLLSLLCFLRPELLTLSLHTARVSSLQLPPQPSSALTSNEAAAIAKTSTRVHPLSAPSSTALHAMSTSGKILLETFALGRTPYKTFSPFLFCMHHNDRYPVGETDHLGPNPRFLRDRDIGMDFSYQDGWSMYHGRTVPGFPEHPHRGFETITVVNQGLVDHSDSIKCTARYGNGDTQWMTAGKGIQHAEMFPLLNTKEPNPLNLFQIWLNLPKKNKFCDPFFGMIWNETKPIANVPVEGSGSDGASAKTVPVQVIAGDLYDTKANPPPPNSWAAERENDVAVWIMDIPAGSAITLPAARGGEAVTRTLYVVAGSSLNVGPAGSPEVLPSRKGARVVSDRALRLEAIGADASVLLLQGRRIDEPVVQHGPFVMNSREEIMECFADFQRTQFGGWPWTSSDQCHSRDTPRHAVHPDGRRELPPNKATE